MQSQIDLVAARFIVVIAGETVTVAPAKLPGIHVYDVAPDEVNVAEPPTQIAAGLLTAVKVGVGFTTSVTVFVPEHTKVVVPVTVYVVVTVGFTAIDVVFNPPGFQV